MSTITTTTLATDEDRDAWTEGSHDECPARDGDGTLWLISDTDDGYLALRWATEDEVTEDGSGVWAYLSTLPLPITIHDTGSGDHDA